MKINEPSRVGRVNPYRNVAGGPSISNEMKKGKKDEVQISAEAKEMLSSLQNPEKIQELKEAVSNGTYHVDARKIAEKLWPFVK